MQLKHARVFSSFQKYCMETKRFIVRKFELVSTLINECINQLMKMVSGDIWDEPTSMPWVTHGTIPTLNFLFTPIKRSALKLNAKRWLIMTSVQQRGRQLSVRALSEGSSRMWWETTGSALCQICGSALPPVSVCSWLKPSGVAHIVLWMCRFHSTPGQQVHINILLHFQW